MTPAEERFVHDVIVLVNDWVKAFEEEGKPCPKESAKNQYTKACWLLGIYQQRRKDGWPEAQKYVETLASIVETLREEFL